ncbi:MAG: response regulator, partial [Myxococcales bacterium]|nr:response regulator [Myxococcales bacterium]
MRELRVLVVDDSALNRRVITQALESVGNVTVVGQAMDGDEALKLAISLQPDLVTLDLEMPRMDGFTFLRLLMAKRPTPVL